MSELYVPIIKWKQGEQIALKQLSDDKKSKILPLIEIVDNNSVAQILKQFNTYWTKPFYIDTSIAEPKKRRFLLSILEEFNNQNRELYPVLYYNDFPDIANDIVKYTNRLALRIDIPGNIDDPELNEMLKECENWINDKKVTLDIILDLSCILDGKEAKRQFNEVKTIISNNLINKGFWNNIIVASSSFPNSLSILASFGEERYKRYDYLIWKKLFESPDLERIKNNIIFSDYGVTKFTDTELDFSKMRYGPLPKARYTIEEFYWVLKGGRDKISKVLSKKYIDLAKEIVHSPEYCGKDFSYGDLDLYLRATGRKTPGGNREWVTIAANHHITFVVEQLSSFLSA